MEKRLKIEGKNGILFLFSFFALLVACPGFSQNEANVWIAPTRLGLNFNGGSPTAFVTGTARGAIDAGAYEGEGCSSIADANGNLLFYTEGVNVYNRNHAVMLNGAGLRGNLSSTQSAVIVPSPVNPTRFYYVFCAPPEELSASAGGSNTSSDGLTYSIVDMTLDGGLGGVTATKNVRITPVGENACEGLTVLPNRNGDGFWVIGHQAADKVAGSAARNKFYVYGVTTANITAGTGVINSFNNQSVNVGTGIAPNGPGTSGNGQVMIKSNSCFNKIAMAFFAKAALIEIYNFNNNTGALTLANSITNLVNNECYGLEFSPNGQFLYTTILATNKRLYQFDISSGVNATINASRFEWTPPASPASLRWGQLQLGPDGKIYMVHHADWNSIGAGSAHASVGVINNPNVSGAGANFSAFQITTTTLTGTGSKHGLPQIYKGFIAGVASVKPGAGLEGLDQVCVGEPASFEATYTQSGTNWRWNIDANVGPNTTNEYTTQNIIHTYSTAGTYDVVLTLDDATCGYEVTERTQIIVNPVVNSAGTLTCGSPIRGNVTSPNGAYTYVWYSNAAATVPIATGTTNVNLPLSTSTGTVYLRAMTSASTTGPTALTNGYNSFPPDGTVASGTSLPFTVSKSVVNFQSFAWAGPAPSWSAGVVTTNYTVVLRDIPFTQNFHSEVVAVTTSCPGCGAANQFTATVNKTLPPGNYEIVITGGTVRQVASWRPEYGPTTDAQNALTYRTSGANNAIASNFQYTLTTITATNLACSKIAAIPYNCPLPVSWLSFSAEKVNDVNYLSWSTASEQNNSHFVIERSYDGLSFDAIGEVRGAGNSSSVLSYIFEDRDANAGLVYYRIKQVDYDGNFTYSSVQVINSNPSVAVSVLPNPNNGIFTVTVKGISESMNVVLTNSLGAVVWTGDLNPSSEISQIQFNLSGLSAGMYFLNLGQLVEKIVIE